MGNVGSLDAYFLTEQLNSFSTRRFQLYLAPLVSVFNLCSKLESAFSYVADSEYLYRELREFLRGLRIYQVQ